MSGFVSDPSPTTIPWRESQLGRELPPAIPQHQDPHHPHHLQQHHQQSYHPHSHSHHPPGSYYSPSVNSEPEDYREWPASGGQESHSPGQSPHSHTSGSLTGSPGLHPSPHNPGARRDSDMSVGVPVAPEHRLSIGERRQEKRKNKRHRLTHNETRFLMSEFARQAHPDAAHRERLAREIPGLTPRQVQVWFQNRRAKLKRMSSDDRERMMKSRALPEEFPILQTLHTYGGRMMGTPLASPSDYSPTPNLGYRPDPLGRRRPLEDDVNMSPTNNAFAGLSFSAPSSNGDLLSPISVSGDRTNYLPYVTSLGPPNQRGNPFSRPAPAPDFRHPTVPRLQLHDVPRSVSEPQSAPVRSTSYSSSPLENGEYQLSPGYSMQTFVEPPRSVPPEGSHSPFGQAPGQNTYTQPYPSPSTASAPLRPPFPSPLGMSKYNKYPEGPMTPHSATWSNSINRINSHKSEFQIPQLSALPDATSIASLNLPKASGYTTVSLITSSTSPR